MDIHDEIQGKIAAMAQPIRTAPRDRIIMVFLPARHIRKHKHKAHWRRVIWVEDNRDDRSQRRHELMMKHDGFWATPREGNAPVPYAPTHWIPDLPILDVEKIT